MKRFGVNDALNYFPKNIPKCKEFLKQWSHINSQTTYVKQHKHVDFSPCNVIDHYQLIKEGGLEFFAMKKLYLEMMMEIGKGPSTMKEKKLEFSIEVNIGNHVCEMIVVFLKKNAL